MPSEKEVSEIRRWIRKELGMKIDSIEFSHHFSFKFTLKTEMKADVDIYKVYRKRGGVIFAAVGGWDKKSPVRNFFVQELPDPKTAAKAHLYILAKAIVWGEVSATEVADAIADQINLPKKYRH